MQQSLQLERQLARAFFPMLARLRHTATSDTGGGSSARLTRAVRSGKLATILRWMSEGRASRAPPTWDKAERKPSCML